MTGRETHDEMTPGDLTSHQNEGLRALVAELGSLFAEAHDLDRLVRVVAKQVSDAVGGCGCDVYVARGDAWTCLASLEGEEWDGSYEGTPLDLSVWPLTMQAVETHEVCVIADRDDPRLTDFERGEFESLDRQSELAVPLVIDERVVGLLDIFACEPRDFSESLELARSVGQLVAGAIANTLLLEQLESSNRDLGTLVACGRDFGSSLDPEAVLQSIATTMRSEAGAVCCDVFEEVDGGIRGLLSVDENGVDDEFPGAYYSLDECLAARIPLDSDGRMSIFDAQSDPRLCETERADFARWGYRAILGLPLRTRNQSLGIALLYDTTAREFERIGLLEGLAQVASQAMANAALHRRMVESASRLAAVSEASIDFSSSLTLEEVLEKTVHRLTEIVDVNACYVYKLVHDDELVCVAAVRHDEPSAWLGKRGSLAEWATSREVIATRRPMQVVGSDDACLSETERAHMLEHGEESCLELPLIAKERVIGTVELIDRRRPRVFADDEVELVQSICNVAALAIDNADLYRGLELRGRETELLNEVARRTAASLDIQEIATAVVDELRYLIPFDRAGLVLVTDEGGLEVVFSKNTRGAIDELVKSSAASDIMEQLARRGVMRLTLPDDLPEGVSRDELGPLRSALLVRLAAGGHVIGGFGLVSERPDAFDRVEPGLIDGVATHLSLALNNARMYDNVKRMHLANLRALSFALNAKDYYTLGHAVRVSAYMAMMGSELGWDKHLVEQVEEAAYLHDIGKIGISDHVLLKPGRLNDREWDLMRHHPVYGADTISPLFDNDLVLAVRHHHERFDGSGYPDGLAGDEIPLVARAMCVADSYDAMSLRRPYRRALTYAESVEELRRCRGKQFDPFMTDAFLRVLSRLEARRKTAIKAAREAARQIDVAKHAVLLGPGDEERPEYGEISAVLRRVRERVVPEGVLKTFARRDGRFVYVVDGDDAPGRRAHIGDEVFADQELPEAFAGVLPDMNALLVDQFGVWLGGRIPIMGDDGEVVAVVGADMPPMDTGTSNLRKDVSQTLASLLESDTGRFRRSEFEGITDGLTGVYTHRYFQERLGEELERGLAEGTSVSLLLADVDGFRDFNQLRGHAAGDRVLHEIARVIESTGRRIDLPARYGGEEFALVLLDADAAGAFEVAERIREKVAATRLTPQGDRLTISIGVATAPADARHKDELIDKAEWALNLAKRQGRDRVAAFAEPAP